MEYVYGWILCIYGVLYVGKNPVDGAFRVFLFDLCRHRAKASMGSEVYTLKSEEEWFAIVAGREQCVFDIKHSSHKHTCSWYLTDPSERMSWEELVRPSKRSLLIDSNVTKGIGCGNSRLVSIKNFSSLLGARVDKVRLTFSAERVRLSSHYLKQNPSIPSTPSIICGSMMYI